MLLTLYTSYLIYFAYWSFLDVDLACTHGQLKFLFYGGPLSVEGLVYFCLGLYCGEHLELVIEFVRRRRSYRGIFIASLLALAVLLGCRLVLPGKFCGVLRPLVIVPALIALIISVSDGKCPLILIKASFCVFAVHYLIANVSRMLGVYEFFSVWVLSVLVGVMVSAVLHRMPRSVCVCLTGGR